MAKLLISGLVVASICNPLLSMETVFAESVVDPAPSITPVNANGKKCYLIILMRKQQVRLIG